MRHLQKRLVPVALAAATALATWLSIADNANAAPVVPPLFVDNLSSSSFISLTLLPAWTTLPGNVVAPLSLTGPTIIHREVNATGSPETINTEIVEMDLVGTGLGFDVEVRAGAGNGFFPGLAASTGQIRETGAGTVANQIDLPIAPTDSFFDVFFDIWVDIDSDGITDVGEVVRNFDAALRMENIQPLPTLPPPPGTDYQSVGKVLLTDLNLGTFAALVLNETINLNVVLADGSNSGSLHASLDPSGGHTHSIIPIPAAFPLFGTGLGILGFLGWRRRQKAQAV